MGSPVESLKLAKKHAGKAFFQSTVLGFYECAKIKI
jgi:hypothetical protein